MKAWSVQKNQTRADVGDVRSGTVRFALTPVRTRGRRPPCANPYCNGQDYDSRSCLALVCLPCGECDHGE